MFIEAGLGAADALSELTHNRWALPVLAYVAREGGGKLVTLSHHLEVAPPSLKRALQRLGTLGLVIPNPGYGHPLRPEYVLGPKGKEAHELSQAIVAWSERQALADQILKKWQLPVLVALTPEPTRFGDVRRQLSGATARAVALALKSHEAQGLVKREVELGYPPIPHYAPSNVALEGREPARLLGEMLAASSSAA